MQLIMETLSPVQVGSGEELLSDLDYIQHHGMPLVVDQNRCFDLLAAQGDVTVVSCATTLSSAVQKLDEPYGYSLPSLHGATCKPQQVREQLKDAQWRPLVPGSSLKGAIRTALLAEYLRNQGATKSDIPFRNNRGKPSSRDKFAGSKVSQAFFGHDPKSDWMRAWKVGDTLFIGDDLQLADVRFLNLGRSENETVLKWKNMSGRNSVTDWKQASGVYAEILAPGSVASFKIHVDDFLLHGNQAKRQLRWHGVPDSFASLREILNNHAEYRLRREVEFYGQYGCQQALNSCIQLMQIMEQKENAIYLQVGWGSGWRGMTGDWQHDAGIEADMRSLYPLGKDGMNEFPKTRRLAVFDGAPSLPFGWLRLWQAEDKPALQQQAKDKYCQQKLLISKRHSAMQSVHEEQQRKVQEETKRVAHLQEEAAEQERIKAEEDARQAAMSPFEREMEAMVAKGNSAIGELLKGLESEHWQGEEACIAARYLKQLLEKNGSWMPEFSGSNKIKKKKHERTLKVMKFIAETGLK